MGVKTIRAVNRTSPDDCPLGSWSDEEWLIPGGDACQPVTPVQVGEINDTYKCYVVFPKDKRKPDEFWLGPYITGYDIYGPALGPYKSVEEIARSDQWQLHQVNLKMGAYDGPAGES